jgi:hypothetical protein
MKINRLQVFFVSGFFYAPGLRQVLDKKGCFDREIYSSDTSHPIEPFLK